MTLIDNFTKEQFQEMVLNSNSMSELAKKIGYKSKSCFDTIRKKCLEYNISLEHFSGVNKNNIKRSKENIFIEHSTASQTTLRKWYKKGEYTPYICSICGQEPFWNGKELTLTLDHINGINNDDRLENLRWVCPNCDRQLDTFCSKNPNRKTYYTKDKKYCIDCGIEISSSATRCVKCQGKINRTIKRPDAETLNKLLIENKGNFSKVAKMFNISDNGLRKWCLNYNLPTHSKDYKEKKEN